MAKARTVAEELARVERRRAQKREHMRGYYQRNKEKWKVWAQSEKRRAYVRNYRRINPSRSREESRLYNAEWRRANPDKAASIQSRSRDRRRELARIEDRNRYWTDPETVRRRAREYQRRKRAGLLPMTAEHHIEVLRAVAAQPITEPKPKKRKTK